MCEIKNFDNFFKISFILTFLLIYSARTFRITLKYKSRNQKYIFFPGTRFSCAQK